MHLKYDSTVQHICLVLQIDEGMVDNRKMMINAVNGCEGCPNITKNSMLLITKITSFPIDLGVNEIYSNLFPYIVWGIGQYNRLLTLLQVAYIPSVFLDEKHASRKDLCSESGVIANHHLTLSFENSQLL